MYNKLNFVTRENIYKRFQKENKAKILMGTMHLLGTGIILTHVK